MAALDFTFVNISSLPAGDYWATPMSLTSHGADGTVAQQGGKLKGGATAGQIYSKLKALTTPPVSGLPGPGGTDGTPLPAVVPGDFKPYGSVTKTGSEIVGSLPRQQRFKLPNNLFFEGMKKKPCFNQWAATLAPTKLVYN